MEYEMTEIFDLYKVYPDNDNFIVDKPNINQKIEIQNIIFYYLMRS